MTAAGLLRPILIVVGCLAITWGALTLPAFWRTLPLEQVSSRIVTGMVYTPDAIAELDPAVESLEAEGASCMPKAMHGAAVVLLHVMEQGYAADQTGLLDKRIAAASSAIRRSLACAPADPFLWIVLFSVENARTGFRSEYLDFIRQSYRLGPHEGWIQVKRNRVVMAVFPLLPPDIAEMALQEFAELVQNRLYEDAVSIALGPGWPIHDRLLAHLSTTDSHERTEFSERLYATGLKLAVPGIDAPGQRPWR
jgi:hypothetical protein